MSTLNVGGDAKKSWGVLNLIGCTMSMDSMIVQLVMITCSQDLESQKILAKSWLDYLGRVLAKEFLNACWLARGSRRGFSDEVCLLRMHEDWCLNVQDPCEKPEWLHGAVSPAVWVSRDRCLEPADQQVKLAQLLAQWEHTSSQQGRGWQRKALDILLWTLHACTLMCTYTLACMCHAHHTKEGRTSKGLNSQRYLYGQVSRAAVTVIPHK